MLEDVRLGKQLEMVSSQYHEYDPKLLFVEVKLHQGLESFVKIEAQNQRLLTVNETKIVT